MLPGLAGFLLGTRLPLPPATAGQQPEQEPTRRRCRWCDAHAELRQERPWGFRGSPLSAAGDARPGLGAAACLARSLSPRSTHPPTPSRLRCSTVDWTKVPQNQ